jgi:hypothetical protein
VIHVSESGRIKCEPTGERLLFFLRDSRVFGITLFPLSAVE